MGLPEGISHGATAIFPWSIAVFCLFWFHFHRGDSVFEFEGCLSWEKLFWYQWRSTSRRWFAIFSMPLFALIVNAGVHADRQSLELCVAASIAWTLPHSILAAIVMAERALTRSCVDIDGPQEGMKRALVEVEAGIVRIGVALGLAIYIPSFRLLLTLLRTDQDTSMIGMIVPGLLPVPIALLFLGEAGPLQIKRALFGHLRPHCHLFRIFLLCERLVLMSIVMLINQDMQMLSTGVVCFVSALFVSWLRPYAKFQHTVLDLAIHWALVAFWATALLDEFLAGRIVHHLENLLWLILAAVLVSLMFSLSPYSICTEWRRSRYQASMAQLARDRSREEIESFTLKDVEHMDAIELAWGWSESQRSALLRNHRIGELLQRRHKIAEALVAAEEVIRPGSVLVQVINQHPDLGVLHTLVECRAGLDSYDIRGNTPLLTAVKQGNLEVSQLLVQSGADVSFRDGQDREVPLHAAARHGHLELCRLLLQQQANPNVCDFRNCRFRTPLGYACASGHTEVSELLVEHGACRTPWQCAKKRACSACKRMATLCCVARSQSPECRREDTDMLIF
eukprot:gnl/TRDRNA2_/TRDRNA2_154271_c0_seq1.p1 gnl/TRDRNA2_/TRDRNA2_154271_c0~~gnl/TRDRNA2_/TRDRNA2_154271_c0_seq1.p1  ORF type:complete len:566 (+),score=35.58 gnl/TRDRNA2_/TRDRNA2_154271_c0_seq1:1-1698(+)